MHMFISGLHVNLGFISRLRNDILQMHSPLKLRHLFTSVIIHAHSQLEMNTLTHPHFLSVPVALYSHISPFLLHGLLPNTFVLLLHIHTHIYTHRCPGLSRAPRATQNDMRWVPAA